MIYNSYLYIYYGKNYVEKFSFNYDNQSYSDLINIIIEHQNLNYNNNNLKFIISSINYLNLKYVHKSKYKDIVKYNKKYNYNIINIDGTFTKHIYNLDNLDNLDNKYIFIAVIKCLKCKKNIAAFNKCLKCLYCFNSYDYINDNLIMY